MGTTDRRSAGLGQAEMLHLALGDQVLHRPGDILDRHVGVDAVLIQQLDPIGAQPFERGLSHGADILRPAVQPVRHHATKEAELGRDDDLVAKRRQRLAEQLLIVARAIGLGGIEEGHAALIGPAYQRDGFVPVGRRPEPEAQAHAPQADRRDFEVFAENTLLHDGVPS